LEYLDYSINGYWIHVLKIHPNASIPERYSISRQRVRGHFDFSRSNISMRSGLTPDQRRLLLRFLDRVEANALLALAEDFPR
jgi:hypothetical protein